ncbi:DNA repair protein RecO, partial [Haemophilus influenzae]
YSLVLLSLKRQILRFFNII